MNQVLNINLGGYPITIDTDAFDALDHYLNTIEYHFKDSEGCEEIIADIETRLAELFNEELGKGTIVGLKNVERAIAIMGTPEDFGAEPQEENHRKRSSHAKSKSEGLNFGKKLFRDPEDTQVAGVCSGLAAYFGVEDPLWIRLAFVLFTISGGAGILIYIILWAITKEAHSPSDRLAMRGEAINVSNIGKKVEEEIDRFSAKVNEWGESDKFESWMKKDHWKIKTKVWMEKGKKKGKKGPEVNLEG